ncbi:cation diffusion facilitator family transporter [Clostridium sp. DMHC 10]|uniref:cation diffusion facilitator family transporter n=1 Tax=Clostridium sp. DMHC 10 TaxID=747377 RepID=UPI00069D03DF|nr:cation diffusion facilitator family transporter [Clostridium sp. DMHC 10]KOF57364.1 cation diffusion facilitator family transporter [Clostridium sp. DMHC 10]
MFSNLIISKFIRNHDDTADKKVRENYGILSSIMGLIVNFILFLIELIIGFMLNSIAVIADAFHNLADVSSSLVTLIGFKLSSKPADKEHPFGHGRIEYLSSLLVSAIILVVGFEFVKSSFLRIIHPEETKFNLISFIIIIIAIPLKLWLSHFNKYIGKKINSSALSAAGADALNDVFILSGVIISLLVWASFHISVDGYVGIVVAIFIIFSGFSIMKSTIDPLLGQAPDPALVKNIKSLAIKYDLIIGIHDLIIHNYGPTRSMASFHAEVPYNVPIMKIHDEIDRAEKEISEKLNMLIVIHMDPILTDSEEVNETRKEVSYILKKFPQINSFHDFRIVGTGDHKKLIFDIVITFDVNISKDAENQLINNIENEIRRVHPKYEAIITIDRDYTETL